MKDICDFGIERFNLTPLKKMHCFSFTLIFYFAHFKKSHWLFDVYNDSLDAHFLSTLYRNCR